MRKICHQGLESDLGRSLHEDEANIYTARLVERLRQMARTERDWWSTTSRIQHMRGAGERMFREIPDAALEKKRARDDALIAQLEEIERQIDRINSGEDPAAVLPGLPSGTYQQQREAGIGNAYGDPDESGRLFQGDPISGFFSPLTRAVESSKTQAASPEQWAATLAQAPGVKREELEWTGVLDWLRAQDVKSIARQDLLDFVTSNGVRVNEITLVPRERQRDQSQEQLALIDELTRVRREVNDMTTAGVAEGRFRDADAIAQEMGFANWAAVMTTDERAAVLDAYQSQPGIAPLIELENRALDLIREIDRIEAGLNLPEAATVTRWDGTALPNGENYRELLFTLPTPYAEAQDAIRESENTLVRELVNKHEFTDRGAREFALLAARNQLSASQQQFVSDNSTIAAEITKLAAAYERRRMEHGAGNRVFMHAHWMQSNVLAHVRLNERVDVNGVRTLFIEEIQSDWHQEGRTRGYQADQTAELIRQIEQMVPADKWGDPEFYDNASDLLADIRQGPATGARADAIQALRAVGATEEQVIELVLLGNRAGAVPNAPFKNNAWAKLAVRRVLRWAAENGFEQIAWTPGALQTERYELDNEDGMAGFYDRVIPNLINDLAKKYRGRAGETMISLGSPTDFYIRQNNESRRPGGVDYRLAHTATGEEFSRFGNTIEVFNTREEAAAFLADPASFMTRVHSFQIPEEMAAAVMQGQPLFHTGAKRTGETVYRGSTEPIKDEAGNYVGSIVRLFQAANLSTFLHEGGHVLMLMLSNLATREGASARTQQLWATTLDWFGITQEQWDGMSDAERVPYHEKWARTFEAYLREGKAPTLSLTRVFQLIKNWMLDIYRTVVLQHDLTPEIRNVFDKMIASDAELEAARSAMGATRALSREIFDTDQQYQSYLSRREQAEQKARDAMMALATDQHYRQQTAWWNRELAKKRRTAAVEVDQQPERRAHDWIVYGKWRGETIRRSERADTDLAARYGWVDPPDGLEAMTLDTSAVEADYGREALDALPPNLRPVNETDVEQLVALARQILAAERKRGPGTLASFIVANGGVRDTGGDVLKILGSYKRRPGLINNRSGRSVDDMALLAYEAGFFGAKPERGAHMLAQIDPIDQTSSPLFMRWFNGSQVVEDSGAPRVVYYGGEVAPVEFDPDTAREGKYGFAHAFQESSKQASREADVTQEGFEEAMRARADAIEREQLEAARPLNVRAREAMRLRALQQAAAEFDQSEGFLTPVFLSIKNPVVIGGENETVLTLEGSNVLQFRANDEAASVEMGGSLGEFFIALREAALAFKGDTEALLALIETIRRQAAANDGRITVSQIYAAFEKAERREQKNHDGPGAARTGILSYRHSGRVQFAAWSEMVRQAFEELGFDGIVDHTARKQSRKGNLRKDTTTKYYPFRAGQVKSAIANVGTYDPRSGNILYQEEDGRPTERQFLDLLEEDLRGNPVVRTEDLDEQYALEALREQRSWFDQMGIDLSADAKELRAQIEAYVRRETLPDTAKHPDAIAEVFGFESGDALLKAWAAMRPRAEVIEEMAQKAVRDEYGDPFADGTIAEAALMEAHNALQSHVIEMELQALDIATGGLARPLARAARQFAEERVMRMRVRDVRNYDRFLRDEQKHAQAAMDALAAGNRAQAAVHKKSQLYAFHTYLAARDMAITLERAETLFKTMGKRATRARIGQALMDQIDQLLERFELRAISNQERVGIAAWYAALEKSGETRSVHIDDRLISDNRRRPWAQLTADEAQGVYETVMSLAHFGRRQDEMLAARDRERIEDVENEIVASIIENGPKAKRHIRGFSETRGERTRTFVENLIGEQTKPEYIARLLDGLEENGATWRNIFRMIADADSTELEMSRLAGIRLRAILEKYSRQDLARMFSIRYEMPELGPDADGAMQHMTRAEMLAVALNSGNVYGREVLMEGYGWSDQQLMAIIDKLDKRDMDTVQEIWDWLDEYRKPRFDVHERVTGVRPERVQPSPLATRHGIYKGGYYHISYSSREDEIQFAREQAAETMDQLFASPYSMTQTKQGALQQRRGSGGKKVRLDLGVLNEQVAEAIHDITHREVIIDTWRILNRPAVQQAIIGSVGRAHYRQLNTWLKAVAVGTRQEILYAERFAETVRRNFTRATFGFKVMSALIQPLGITNAVPRVGALPLFQAVARIYLTGNWQKHLRFAQNSSPYMRSLMDNFDRDVRDAMGNAGLSNDRVLPVGYDKAAFWLMGVTNLGTALPIWSAAYDNAINGKVENIEAMDHASAVAHADSVVRMTQGSGAIKDQSSIMGRRGMVRILTMYMTWASSFYNSIFFEQIPGAISGRIPFHQFLWNMLWTWFLPATIMMMIYGGLDREDDETDVDYAVRLALQYAAYPLSGVIILNNIINATVEGYTYEVTPLNKLGAHSTNVARDLWQRDLDEGTFRSAFMAAGYATGLPAPQAWITGDYVADLAQGQEDPAADPVDAAREALLRDTR